MILFSIQMCKMSRTSNSCSRLDVRPRGTRRAVTNRADWKTGSLCRVGRACIATLCNIASKIRCSCPDERKELSSLLILCVIGSTIWSKQFT